MVVSGSSSQHPIVIKSPSWGEGMRIMSHESDEPVISLESRYDDGFFGLYRANSVVNYLSATTGGTSQYMKTDLATTSTSNIVHIEQSDGVDAFRIRANNSVIGSVAGLTVTDRTQFAKAAIKYKSGEIKAFINGVQVLSATDSFTFSDALAELDLDRGNATKDFEGKVKCVAVFKEALDNDELECLTGSGFDSFTALAEAGSYTII